MASIRAIQPNVPVLLLSGYTPARLELEVLDSTATAYLAKPFRHESLARTIEDLLGPVRRAVQDLADSPTRDPVTAVRTAR
jgi:DNA-binding response OmpR family regulator